MQSVSFAAAEFTEECFARANQQVVPIVKVPKFQDGALVSHGVGHTRLKQFLLVIVRRKVSSGWRPWFAKGGRVQSKVQQVPPWFHWWLAVMFPSCCILLS